MLRNAFPDEFIDALEEHATGCDVDICKSTPVVSVKEKDEQYLVTTSDGSTFIVDIVVCTTMLRSMIRIEGLPELLGSIYEEEQDLPADMRSGKLVSNITGVSEYDNEDFPKMLLGEVNNQSVQITFRMVSRAMVRGRVRCCFGMAGRNPTTIWRACLTTKYCNVAWNL